MYPLETRRGGPSYDVIVFGQADTGLLLIILILIIIIIILLYMRLMHM
uniref:E5 beta n=1 Tax=human papillomavirus 102 TaxID=338327 RepID=A0A159E0F6_9PAPI|nr:E5 beta [human papillomavirus 102]